MPNQESLSVYEARERFFAKNGFSTAEYQADWITLKIGPLRLPFPNVDERKKAVALHDLHHLATGYDTDMRGEAELAAWELAAGCAHNRAALVLNSMVALTGLLIAPVRTFRAWRRGRSGQTLYREGFDQSLLLLRVDALQERMGVVR